ncbi:Uncharacterised protein [uncultured archaeon]|nr:Uncharacterised protein [uncultured archaeon]
MRNRLRELYQRGLNARPLLKPRRAQIKMFETIAVLIVFFFLLFTGSIFYFGAQKSALQKEKVKASEQYALQIVLKALYMPELDWSFLVTQKDNCIDKIKLSKLAGLITADEKAQTDYYSEFGYATITVNEAYPDKTKTQLYNKLTNEFTGNITTQSPILLYDAVQDSYAFGIIEVNVYV